MLYHSYHRHLDQFPLQRFYQIPQSKIKLVLKNLDKIVPFGIAVLVVVHILAGFLSFCNDPLKPALVLNTNLHLL
nr:MAG TPA: hypothetical protein [Crassvirales sp.]